MTIPGLRIGLLHVLNEGWIEYESGKAGSGEVHTTQETFLSRVQQSTRRETRLNRTVDVNRSQLLGQRRPSERIIGDQGEIEIIQEYIRAQAVS